MTAGRDKGVETLDLKLCVIGVYVTCLELLNCLVLFHANTVSALDFVKLTRNEFD